MSRFEFSTVLVSIVIAFAYTELLATWASVIRHRPHVRVSLPYALFSLAVGLSLLLFWFGLWSFRDVPFDRAVFVALVMAPALAMALVCHLLQPELAPDATPDALEGHYFRVSPWCMSLTAFSAWASTGADMMLLDPEAIPAPAFFVVVGLAYLTLAFTRRRLAHVAVVGASVVFWLLALFFTEIE